MEIFNLPNECKIDKNIPKEMIYKNAEANEKLKRVFIDNVEKIRFMYLLNFSNSNIQNYINDKERFEEIDFIKIILREKGKENVISKLFHQLIPKSTVIILEFKTEILISTSNKKIEKERVIVEEVFNSNWIEIENKILENISKSDSVEELIQSVKSKRYTYTRIRRMLFNILLDITKSDISLIKENRYNIGYARVLGFNDRGRNIIKKIKNKLIKKGRLMNRPQKVRPKN